jgi:hypothetical protein
MANPEVNRGQGEQDQNRNQPQGMDHAQEHGEQNHPRTENPQEDFFLQFVVPPYCGGGGEMPLERFPIFLTVFPDRFSKQRDQFPALFGME